jgi:hypothetical protein
MSESIVFNIDGFKITKAGHFEGAMYFYARDDETNEEKAHIYTWGCGCCIMEISYKKKDFSSIKELLPCVEKEDFDMIKYLFMATEDLEMITGYFFG